MLLEWEQDEDNDGNTIYRAESQIHSEGDPFHWRIRPKLMDDDIQFGNFESDRELIGEAGEYFDTPGQAKAECQRLEDEAVANARAHA